VEPVDLRAVVETAGREAGGPVRLAAGDWPTVRGDRALLTLALTHMLRTAVEAAGPGPPEVAVAVADGQVRVSVRDRGDGLRTTDPRLLIRPWRSVKPGHRGLGLVTAERIARLHGGALSFNALPDGALVTLSLPAR
jgi:signal transduction histidine kinase